MSLSKKERDDMRCLLHGAATLTLNKSSAYQLFDDLDDTDKARELAVKRAVIATDKLHAAGLQAKDKEIKKLSAEIDTHRLRIIRLREVLDG